MLNDAVVPFTSGDGRPANLIHVEGPAKARRAPVLLVHGAGVRANIFRAPVRNLVDVLVDEGFDVWLENWRASIDLGPTRWTLDQAAVYDHPQAVRTVLDRTGATEVKAVVHCQGSTSFMMSAVAGLVPAVSTIVSNAVSLHPRVPALARWKIELLHRPLQAITRFVDPQWAVKAPNLVAAAIAGYVRATHHECTNAVCHLASFTYGVGKPTLWSHDLLDDATHEWLRAEFGPVPLSFFDQMAHCLRAGHLVGVDRLDGLPADFGVEAPRTDADITLIAGARNVCFSARSQELTFDFLERRGPGHYQLHVFPDYGHLDVFMGRDAHVDVFPTIVAALHGR